MCQTLYLVIPCYNEEDVLPETARRLDIKVKQMIKQKIISEKSRVLFVDDGSNDNTWEIITNLNSENKHFLGISLAHNSGEQNAYIAGMLTAKEYADVIITMDADLQDDIDAIDKMVDEYHAGNDIVYGVRVSRKKESFLVRLPANAFYKTMKLIGTELLPNHSQYRLMSRRAIEAFSAYGEVNLFLPALIPLLGFKSSIVYHERTKRHAGKTKYSYGKLFSLAIQAITSFSLAPIRLITGVGVLFLFVAFGIAAYMIMQAIAGDVAKWLWLLFSIWVIGATVVMSIGIVGEYVGKTYGETKRRPRYYISESLMDIR